MKIDEIQYYIKMLIGNLSFHVDYQAIAKGNKKLLLVEGQTDKKFVEKILKDDVVCIVANKAFGNASSFEKQSINCKEAIGKTVYGIKQIPMLVKCPNGADKWALFGMIDRDDGVNPEYDRVRELFITDTRDLETQIISTDDKVFSRINVCSITHTDVMNSLYMAYQLEFLRNILRNDVNERISLTCINTGRNEVELGRFFEDNMINVEKMIDYIIACSNSTKSSKGKILSQLSSSKEFKKEIDKDFRWKRTPDSFSPDKIYDFWTKINGHDVLEIIRYLNHSAGEAFGQGNSNCLNREFEFELVEKYDHTNLVKTHLYENMQFYNLV